MQKSFCRKLSSFANNKKYHKIGILSRVLAKKWHFYAHFHPSAEEEKHAKIGVI